MNSIFQKTSEMDSPKSGVINSYAGNDLLSGKPVCYHCGQGCDETFHSDGKSFCCVGCKSVYEILNANDLCQYYTFDKNPGVRLSGENHQNEYAELDEQAVRRKIIEFDSEDFSRVRFYVPAIHCASCIWLLEHLERIDGAIIKSEVNFGRKSLCIDFNPRRIALSKVASIIATLGYPPQIRLEKESQNKTDSSIIQRLVVAGFCFGNVMLFSFPEYLGLDQTDKELMRLFSWLNIALSVPVFFFSATPYFTSASKSFRQKQINIDVPIALGLVALFFRSIFDILSYTGPGYLDSFTGLVFFLLIGRWFQNRTYEALAFDRDFKSYFPLAVQKNVNDEWKAVVVYELEKNDTIRIRNMEIVPADSLLLDDHAYIDYSFVTGESRPVKALQNDLIYAGGRLIGQPVRLTVVNKTSQSHLTTLWNNDAFRKDKDSYFKKMIDRAARRFTWVVMVIGVMTAIYWQIVSPERMWLIFTSVLMVACPCALALAAPFTYGNMMRLFGRHKFYLKNADVIERLAGIDAVVFDKTGTVSMGHSPGVKFSGFLTDEECGWIKQLTSYSTHPLSSQITKSITNIAGGDVQHFKEIPGKGIEASIDGHSIIIGSRSFVGAKEQPTSATVFVAIDGVVRGHYTIATSLRQHVQLMVAKLGEKCKALLSGDNDKDREEMRKLFNPSTVLLFNQSPHDKLEYIQRLQQEGGHKVLMVGDGLNDSGALQQSDVGIAVTDDAGVFTPACDAILQGDKIGDLSNFISLARTAVSILKTGFIISFLYNSIALAFVITGHLTPLVAAILMPLSSISVVSFSAAAVALAGRRQFKD